MNIHVSKASAVVVQRISAASADWFMEWQRGVTLAAEGFPGYNSTDVYPPADCKDGEWVVLLHFDDEKALQGWLDSPVRKEWVDKLRLQLGDFDLQAIPGGFGPWFADRARQRRVGPPAWKMVMIVVLGLFPTVMLLTIFPGRLTSHLGFSFSVLIGNLCSSTLLQWPVVPAISKVFDRWIYADPVKERGLSVGGAAVILALYVLMAVFFQLVDIHP